MSFNKIYVLVFITIFFSCNEKIDVLNETEKNQIRVDVLQMFNDYHESIKKDGLRAEFKYLDDSSDFYWVPPGYNSALKYDSIKSILIENSKAIHKIEFSFGSIEIYPLSHSLACYTGIAKGKMIDTSQTKSSFKIIESGTLIKRSDGWKLLNGQSRTISSKP